MFTPNQSTAPSPATGTAESRNSATASAAPNSRVPGRLAVGTVTTVTSLCILEIKVGWWSAYLFPVLGLTERSGTIGSHTQRIQQKFVVNQGGKDSDGRTRLSVERLRRLTGLQENWNTMPRFRCLIFQQRVGLVPLLSPMDHNDVC